MKVFFEQGQTSFPKGGKKEGIVFCYYRQKDLCMGRKYSSVPFLPQNAKIISLEKLTLNIWHNLPLRFKHDLCTYAQQYKTEYPDLRRKHLNSYSIFLKIIHKIDRQCLFSQKENASYNLYVLLFGHLSVADFIYAGFLLPVRKGYKLTARIIPIVKSYPQIEQNLFPELTTTCPNRHSKPG